MSKEDSLRDTLNQAAKEIAEAQSNPRTWQSWMVYLLNQLESESKAYPVYQGAFTDMLTALEDAIRNRMRTGGW